jgi:hypothetical protein
MRKVLFLFVFALLAIQTTTVSALAPDQQPKTVQGNVMLSGGGNAVGAAVVITCGANVLNDTTGTNGRYGVTFADGACTEGDAISVVASLNGDNGSANRTASSVMPQNMDNIILAAIAVPEFGTITGLIALAGSAGGYLALKRRTLFNK